MEQKNDYLSQLRAVIATAADAVRATLGQRRQYRVVDGKVVGADNAVVGFLLDRANGAVPDFVVNWLGARAERINNARRRDRAQVIAKQAGEQISAIFYVAIADDMRRLGFGPLLDMLSGPGWLQWAGSEHAKSEAARLKRDARALEKWKVQGPGAALDGEAWRALNLYMELAYPIHVLNPVAPPTINETADWRQLVDVWPTLENFRKVAGGIAYLTQHQETPYSDKGAAKIRSLYSAELGFLDGGISLDGARPGNARQGKTELQKRLDAQRQAAERQAGNRAPQASVPSWPSKELPGGAASVIKADVYYLMTEAQRAAWFTARGYPAEYAYPDGEQRYRARVGAAKKSGNGLLWLGGAAVVGGGLFLAHRNRT